MTYDRNSIDSIISDAEKSIESVDKERTERRLLKKQKAREQESKKREEAAEKARKAAKRASRNTEYAGLMRNLASDSKNRIKEEIYAVNTILHNSAQYNSLNYGMTSGKKAVAAILSIAALAGGILGANSYLNKRWQKDIPMEVALFDRVKELYSDGAYKQANDEINRLENKIMETGFFGKEIFYQKTMLYDNSKVTPALEDVVYPLFGQDEVSQEVHNKKMFEKTLNQLFYNCMSEDSPTMKNALKTMHKTKEFSKDKWISAYEELKEKGVFDRRTKNAVAELIDGSASNCEIVDKPCFYWEDNKRQLYFEITSDYGNYFVSIFISPEHQDTVFKS